MKRTILSLIIAVFAVSGSMAQQMENVNTKRTSLIGWNGNYGLSVGYSHMHKPFDTMYHGCVAPTNLCQIETFLYGFYVALDYWSKSTGYDVYGYKEGMVTFGMKFGPSVRFGRSSDLKWVVTPFAGFMNYFVKDESNNDIGARDEYGTKEKLFISGCKISAVYKKWMLGIHYSNRDLGVTLGYEWR